MFDRMMADRIAGQAIAWSLDGKRNEVAAWLRSLGWEAELGPRGDLRLKNSTGLAGGLAAEAGPFNAAHLMAMMVLGPFWPLVMPTLLDRVDQLCKGRPRTAKTP